MEEPQKARLLELARLGKDQVGASEENVKQKIVVPLLEAFGHHRNDLDFEYSTHGKRIDIFVKGLPRDSKLIIDTKAYDENLENHLEQIEEYTRLESSLQTIIVNGEELRIYSLIRGLSFKDSLFFSLRREDWVRPEEQAILAHCLGREALLHNQSRLFLDGREKEMLDLRMQVEHLKGEYEQEYKAEEVLLAKLSTEADRITREIAESKARLTAIAPRLQDDVGRVYASAKLPPPHFVETTYAVDERDLTDYSTRTPSSYVEEGKAVEIELPPPRDPREEPTWRRYTLIPVSRRIRPFFPGYKVTFTLETDKGSIMTHMASGPKEAEIGHPTAGEYFSKGLASWYDGHKELRVGDVLVLRRLSEKRYSLDIRR